MSKTCRVLAGTGTTVLLACALAAVAHADYLIAPNLASGITAAWGDPAAPPPGVNRSDCRLTGAKRLIRLEAKPDRCARTSQKTKSLAAMACA